jgi:competence protein ComFC
MTAPLPRLLRLVGGRLLDGLYPRACFACEAVLDPVDPAQGPAAWLCPACQEGLEPIEPPFCSVCGEPFAGAEATPFRCWNCEDRGLAFDFARAACKSAGPVRTMIHAFKYRRDLAQRAPLAELLRTALADPRLAGLDPAGWRLVPVPLHPLRRLWRGYNQSLELCRQLGQATGLATVCALRRVRLTRAQAGLDRARRLENLRGIFAPARRLPGRPAPLAGKNVLLVDDVLTTGATAHECARVLKKQAGVEKVVVITAARG